MSTQTDDTQAYIRHLEDQVAELSALLTGPDDLSLPSGVTLTLAHTKLLKALVAAGGKVCSVQRLHRALYGTGPDTPRVEIIKVYVSKLRERLHPFCKIITHTGIGYALDTASIPKLTGKELW